MVKALKSNMPVFTQVTASGKRGRSGGGHAKLLRRRIRYAVTRPMNTMVSNAMNTAMPSCALLIGGAGNGCGGGPPPKPGNDTTRRPRRLVDSGRTNRKRGAERATAIH